MLFADGDTITSIVPIDARSTAWRSGQALDGSWQPVAATRRVLEPLVHCSLAHLPFEIADRFVVTERTDHIVDDLPVVLLLRA